MATLIIFRHGQSVWNLENKFTGWVDVELTEKGMQEAKNAGIKLKPFKFDLALASKDDCNCKAYLKHSDLPCISIESRLKTQQAGFYVASTL